MIYIIRIQLSAHNSQGFGPNATATIVTLDIGEFTVLRLVIQNGITLHNLLTAYA